MSGGIGLTSPTVGRTQRLVEAQAILSEPAPYILFATATTPVSQSVYGTLIGLHAGDLVTGILFRNGVAAAGTAPTLARFGLANAAGQILALSADVKAAASWPVGPVAVPLASPLVVPASGGYYPCFVVNGTWGSTQPTPLRVGVNAAGGTALGAGAPPCFIWTGLTDLPAVGQSLTITTSGGICYYLAVY